MLIEVLCMSEGRRHCSDELNICYELYELEKTQSGADAFCLSRNGTLATILDNKTQQYISNLLRSEYWIGGKLVVMDQWTWVDGSRFPGQWAMHHYLFAALLSLAYNCYNLVQRCDTILSTVLKYR